MGILTDYGIHGFPHEGEDEIAFVQCGGSFLTVDELVNTVSQNIAVQLGLLISKLLLIVIEIIHDGFELVGDLSPLLPEGPLPAIVRVAFLFSRCQISVSLDQLPDALLCRRPADQEVCIFFIPEPSLDGHTLGIVQLPVAGAGDAIGFAAPAVFVFQEGDILLRGQLSLEMVIDAVLAV